MTIVRLLILVTLIFNFVASTAIDDAKCDAQLEYFDQALSKHEKWAIELFDAWTKLQSGIVSGNINDFGHFDQCVKFRHESNVTKVEKIQGKHCMIFYRALENATEHESDRKFDWREIVKLMRERSLRLGAGVCLPSICSAAKIRHYVNETVLSSSDLVITNDYDQSIFCSTNDSIPFETIDVVAIVILSIFALLLLSSTLYEILMIQRNQRPHELFSAFSVYKNGKKLFDMKRGQSTSIIHCLPGLRTLSMFHIMLGHRYGWQRGLPNINAGIYSTADGEWFSKFWSAIITIHPIAVDCFFVLGGCLLARSILNAINKRKFNIPKLYLHRYLRVTPVLAILILIVLSIFKFMGSGPFYKFTIFNAQVNQCKSYYWSALIHIQNYYNPLEACIQPSWYLSVDYQLVLLSPLILYPAYYFGWKFLWTLPTYIIGIQIWTFIAAMQNEYKPVRILMPYDVGLKSAEKFYFPTHIRCGPWLIGIILGYIFYKLKNRKISINKYLNTSMWILSIGTIVAILLGIFGLQSVEYSDNKIAHALFFALQRNSWGLAIAWIVFSCEMGYGSVIRKFLELPIWIPLGRMSLSFYLVHGLYFSVQVGSSKVSVNFDDFQLMHLFAGDIIVTTMLATLLWLTFEEPILLIENFTYKCIEQRRLKPSK